MTSVEFDQAVAQLDERVCDLYERSRILFGSAPTGAPTTHVVRDLGERLRNTEDSTVGPTAARQVARALLADLDSENFWRSALGQVIAWHIGYPQEWVPVKLVGALLGASRQYGYQATEEARLTKMLAGGWLHVKSADVLDLIRARRPRPSWGVK